MSFERVGLPIGSGIAASITEQLSVIGHFILVGAILMAGALPVRAASPPDCSLKEQGAWVKAKMIPRPPYLEPPAGGVLFAARLRDNLCLPGQSNDGHRCALQGRIYG